MKSVNNEIHYSIAAEIFQSFPGYCRGVVIAHNVINRPSPAELLKLLRQAEAEVRTNLNIEQLAEEARIKSWREAYRSFGAKPSEFRSSIEGMVRRVLRNEPLPSINALVDIGNIVSLRHLVPAGGHAIDVLTGDIALRLATGKEEFVAFGSEVMEHPVPGEIIFVEGNTVLTRRWTWRQAKHTLTLPETTAIEFNIDGLPPVTAVEVEAAGREVMDLVGRFCGGNMRFKILSSQNPRLLLAGAS
jgi:DNA/RNA-binding domain of Phe-tRNA-synthetase-like protein